MELEAASGENLISLFSNLLQNLEKMIQIAQQQKQQLLQQLSREARTVCEQVETLAAKP